MKNIYKLFSIFIISMLLFGCIRDTSPPDGVNTSSSVANAKKIDQPAINITNETIKKKLQKINITANGKLIEFDLSEPIEVPLSKEDALFLIKSIGCCSDEIEEKDGFWESETQKCFGKIEIQTANMKCEKK